MLDIKTGAFDRLKPKEFTQLKGKFVLRFGQSSRTYELNFKEKIDEPPVKRRKIEAPVHAQPPIQNSFSSQFKKSTLSEDSNYQYNNQRNKHHNAFSNQFKKSTLEEDNASNRFVKSSNQFKKSTLKEDNVGNQFVKSSNQFKKSTLKEDGTNSESSKNPSQPSGFRQSSGLSGFQKST